ncbi:MAG: 3-dehydroquinate synthase [Succinivibrionaceae bacterium]|nr:3-dehydroquinate synthase [Succinivibrionaceae bacterium]
MKLLNVDLADRSYPISIGGGLLDDASSFKAAIRHPRVIVVTNTTVAPLYLERLKNTLSGFCSVCQCILPDGEKYKTLDSFNQALTAMLENSLGRDSTVLALGGGVVGDIAGFAASAYQRGVDFVQVPTTLLAQVDSSVGGKTGVNHRLGKNMIGAFYQPRAVIIDTDCLQTLPARELSAGLAEVIKYGIIWDADLFACLEASMSDLLKLDGEKLEQVISRCCAIKAEVVHQDEREGGVRALLNLGHTFGHAIENHMGYGVWLHGEAVAAGTVMASAIARMRGHIGQEEFQRIVRLHQAASLPVSPPENMTADDFLSLMRHDKKVKAGAIRYVIPTSIGSAEVFSDVTRDEVEQSIGKPENE